MGIYLSRVDFYDAPPSPEVLCDRLAEHLRSPVELTIHRAGFTVGVAVSANHTRFFAVARLPQVLELQERPPSPQYELVARVLMKLGGEEEPFRGPAGQSLGRRFRYEGALPTPEQVHARITRLTNIPTEQPSEYPEWYTLTAPAMEGGPHFAELQYEPHRITLTSGLEQSLVWPARDVLVELGGWYAR